MKIRAAFLFLGLGLFAAGCAGLPEKPKMALKPYPVGAPRLQPGTDGQFEAYAIGKIEGRRAEVQGAFRSVAEIEDYFRSCGCEAALDALKSRRWIFWVKSAFSPLLGYGAAGLAFSGGPGHGMNEDQRVAFHSIGLGIAGLYIFHSWRSDWDHLALAKHAFSRCLSGSRPAPVAPGELGPGKAGQPLGTDRSHLLYE